MRAELDVGIVIVFDLAAMRDVMECLDVPPKPEGKLGHGDFVTEFDGPLADWLLGMVRLLNTPRGISILAPKIMREICYWLLTGPHGNEVAKVVLAKSHVQRVVTAIHALRDRFTENVRIEELAAVAQMSPSASHRQFKALTSVTSLKYQEAASLA
jgi:hypothetical protein